MFERGSAGLARIIGTLVLRFQRLFPMVDFFDDGAGGCRPDKGLGFGVVMFEIIVDRPLEVDDGVEHAVTDALSSDFGEEALDQVELGRRGRREMHVESRMLGQPRLDLGMIVRGIVVRQSDGHRGPVRPPG